MAMSSLYYQERRNLAFALMSAGVISAERLPLLHFNLGIPPMTETLAGSVARYIRQLINANGLKFDAIACISPSEPFANILARLTGKGKSTRKCIYIGEHEHAGEKQAAALKGRVSMGIQKVLLVSGVTIAADTERRAIQFLDKNGMTVSDAVTLVNLGQGAEEELKEWGCTLRHVFSGADLQELHKTRHDKLTREATVAQDV